MASELIELEDGILVEVEIPGGQVQQILGESARVVESSIESSIGKIKPILVKVTNSLVNAWKDINQDMTVETAEIELGFSFEAEGNIYLAKVGSTANINVKLTLKPPKP